MTSADFAYVTSLVRQRSSIDLQPGKEYLLESRLGPVARTFGEADLSALIGRLRGGDETMLDAVVEALTTNETSWFRDAHPFETFRQHLLPAIATGPPRRLVVWSAASSSGQEAYSLAMMLHEWLPGHPEWSAGIVGTDISRRMVDRARAARYSQLEINRGMPAANLVKYFEQAGRDWVIRKPLRDLCRFEWANLALPPVGIPQCDVVFLRNVLIYFNLETKRLVIGNIRRVLRPGGYLVLGGSEATTNTDDAFTRMELGRAVVFKHTGGGP